MNQDFIETPVIPLDSSDSAHVSHFTPVMDQDVYEPLFTDVLKSGLDSNIYMFKQTPVQDTFSCKSMFHAEITSMDMNVRGKPQSGAFYLCFILYLSLIAFNRVYCIFFGDTGSKRNSIKFLPHLLYTEKSNHKFGFSLYACVALVIGITISFYSFAVTSGKVDDGWGLLFNIFVLVSLYVTGKLILYFLTAFLLNMESGTRCYVTKKTVWYYNAVMLMVLLSFLQFEYECIPWFMIIGLMGIAYIGTLINGFLIFSRNLKTYGIFLYLCSLEFLPIAIIVKMIIDN